MPQAIHVAAPRVERWGSLTLTSVGRLSRGCWGQQRRRSTLQVLAGPLCMCLTIWLSCPLGSCSTVQTTLSSGRDPRKMEVALLDVRKEITFCRKVNIPIIGLVEDMTTFVCPKCKTKMAVFPATTGM
ncbi:uncharacterized protein LOC135097328 isoform X2 [Scylla paramamosain]|uniref:uncharacterized protein LOC135097328 isoform X2 n=1 Tax=Scylla paramamosain TaxID=85552 RepID=UPI003083ADBB